MKNITLTFGILALNVLHSFGQINPVDNLTWAHEYVMPHNYFELHWDEPASPHGELIGYNIYRENELYRFQTENSLYNLQPGSNCGEDFLMYGDENGFYAHVTAVYNPGQIESIYSQTVFVEGALLGVNDMANSQPVFYPNPTTGLLHIENENFKKIVVYRISGEKIIEWDSHSQIDLSNFSKGVYLIKLISEDQTMIKKIIVE